MGDPTSDRYDTIHASLEALYNAGRSRFPEKAEDCAAAAGDVDAAASSLDAHSARAGDPRPLQDALRTCQFVHQGLTRLVRSLDYCAIGLVHVADSFAARDADAAAAMEDLLKRLPPSLGPEHVPVPSPLGDLATGGAQPSAPAADPADDLEERNRIGDRLGGDPAGVKVGS